MISELCESSTIFLFILFFSISYSVIYSVIPKLFFICPS